MHEHETPDHAAEDLEVPADESTAVKGGIGGGVFVAAGDVNGNDVALRKIPSLHKSTDVTLKRG